MPDEKQLAINLEETYILEKFDGDWGESKTPIERITLVYKNGVLIDRKDESWPSQPPEETS